MNSLRTTVLLLLTVVSAFGVSQTPPAATTPPAPKKDEKKSWTPDKKLAAKLSPETRLDIHFIRPPKGFTMRMQPGTGGSKGYAWMGTSRGDGSTPKMSMSYLMPPPGVQMSLSALMDKLITIPTRVHPNLQRKSSERGFVGGCEFMRTRWTAKDEFTGIPISGFIMVAFVKDHYVHISGEDGGPSDKNALKLLETAATTFREK